MVTTAVTAAAGSAALAPEIASGAQSASGGEIASGVEVPVAARLAEAKAQRRLKFALEQRDALEEELRRKVRGEAKRCMLIASSACGWCVQLSWKRSNCLPLIM
jgi:hypothetical protein